MAAPGNLAPDAPLVQPPGADGTARVRRNLAASMLAVGWTAALQVALVPVYVHLLGPAGYGLVGFFVALRTALQVCDIGMSTALSRELAAVQAGTESAGAGRAVVRALGRANWGVGIALSALLALAAPWIATHWLRGGHADAAAVRLMALALLLSWPITFYENGLYGLQRLVAQGTLRIVFGTLSAVAAVLVLARIAATPHAFFASQAAVAAVQCAVTAGVFHRLLPGRGTAAAAAPARLWRSTVGAGAAMASMVLLTQFATLLLARLLSAERYGAYALAVTAANGLLVLVAPFYNVTYPRLSELVARADTEGTRRAFRGALRSASLLVLPAAATLAVMAEDVLRLWTRDAALAAAAAPMLRALAVGLACTALSQLPFALELAHRRARALTRLNLGAVAAGTLALVIGVPASGMAALWALTAVLVLHFLACVLFLPRHAFAGSTSALVRQDLLAIAFASLAGAGGVRLAAGPGAHGLGTVLLAGVLALALATLASPPARAFVAAALRSRGAGRSLA